MDTQTPWAPPGVFCRACAWWEAGRESLGVKRQLGDGTSRSLWRARGPVNRGGSAALRLLVTQGTPPRAHPLGPRAR